jgi:multidrug efflux pump subunit AcrB
LNFSSPAPIELQIRGNNLDAGFDYANLLLPKIRAITGVADARIQQSRRQPVFDVDVDRTRAQQVGITMRDITSSLVANLAGSSQVAPTFWLNPQNGVQYPIVIQTPQYRLDTLAALADLPVGAVTAILRCSAPSPASRVPAAMRWSANTTSSHWCKYMQRRKDVISVR